MHKQKIDLLRRGFPKTKRWLDWWTMSDVKAMLFPSRRPMLEDLPEGATDGLPDTTNVQESLHRLYYISTQWLDCLQQDFFHVADTGFLGQFGQEVPQGWND
jgi:hypothetical protein